MAKPPKLIEPINATLKDVAKAIVVVKIKDSKSVNSDTKDKPKEKDDK